MLILLDYSRAFVSRLLVLSAVRQLLALPRCLHRSDRRTVQSTARLTGMLTALHSFNRRCHAQVGHGSSNLV
jgi:hypothetical protein